MSTTPCLLHTSTSKIGLVKKPNFIRSRALSSFPSCASRRRPSKRTSQSYIFRTAPCRTMSTPPTHQPSRIALLALQTNNYDTTHPWELRKKLGSYGFVPPAVESYEIQKERCLRQLKSKSNDLERYQYLSLLRKTSVHLFYRLAVDHMTMITPLIYTPVVGQACEQWSEIYAYPEGMVISYADKGRIAEVLADWPQAQVEMTVITDGSRILGLGDLGMNGMGIPVGKLSLYSAVGGIRPDRTLPITLDIGTNNDRLLRDPLYLGHRAPRATEEQEMEILDELMEALVKRWPNIVIQHEDFKNPFPFLEKYAPMYTMFNDDVQGTGAVAMAGMINALALTDVPLREHKAVVLGAGSAAVGVCKQIVAYLMSQGLSEDEARRIFYLVDTKGLVAEDRGDTLAEHKKYFARPAGSSRRCHDLTETVQYVKPSILIGLSTITNSFTHQILNWMAEWNKRPIIFPLSNPIDKEECTMEDAIRQTDGRCIFASGSPFADVTYNGKVYHNHQGNNLYCFPAIGLAAVLCRATHIPAAMIYAAGASLATARTPEEIKGEWLYPHLQRARAVTVTIARGVIRAAQKEGVDRETSLRSMSDDDLDAFIRQRMYDPHQVTALLEKEHGVPSSGPMS